MIGIAIEFAKEGAHVMINYHTDKEGAEETAKQVKQAGGKALISQGDVGDEDYINELIKKVVSEFGHLDIMVNNAGIGISSIDFSKRKEIV